ncbi:phage tail tape measure protein, TP901 family, core region [Kosakonia sacchari]|nr:phage tail tape measure protein, TP901 family, core region [Kosakonia sacchari]
MSNSTNIDALLTAVDQATRPFKNLQTANVSLAAGIKETEKNLRGLYDQVAQIDGLTRTQNALTEVSQQLKVAKESTRALASELKKIDQPTQRQITALDKARDSVSALQQKHDNLRQSVKGQRQVLQQAGISTRAPATAKQRLQSSISDNTGQLNAQRAALAQENRQKRAEKIQASQQTIQGIAGKVSAVGKTGMSVATSGFNIGKKLLQPGYEQSLKNSAPAQAGSEVSHPASAQAGNLGTDLQALQSAYQSLSVDIFSTQESSLRQLVQTAAVYLGQLQQWVQNNQGLVQTFGLIATVVVGVAGAIGTVAGVIAPVFTGISTLITIATTFGSVFTTVCGGIMAVLGSLTLPIVGVIAIVAAAALAIYTWWEPISAFFSGVMAGIGAAFAPLAGLFAPLQPLFDVISSSLQNIKQLFSDLITPVQASQETLNQCATAGFYFGQMLSGSIALVIEGVKILGSSLSWVLEKLGIIDKKPVLEVPKPPTDASGSQSYIQPTSAMPGFNNYQAAKPAGGHTFSDNSRTEYNITLQGDVAPGSNNERYLQDLFRQDADNRRNNALSQFNPSGGFAL